MLLKHPVSESLYSEGILAPVQFLMVQNQKTPAFEKLNEMMEQEFLKKGQTKNAPDFDLIARPLHRIYLANEGTRVPVIRLKVGDLKLEKDGEISCSGTRCEIDLVEKKEFDHEGDAVAVYGEWIHKLWGDSWESLMKIIWPQLKEISKKKYIKQFPEWPHKDLVEIQNVYSEASTFSAIDVVGSGHRKNLPLHHASRSLLAFRT